jgi:hypothetical protein
MKLTSFSVTPRFRILLAVSALLILGLKLSYRKSADSSTSTTKLIKQVKEVPTKLYNEDLVEWFNVTFLPQMKEEHQELTDLLDNHDITKDITYNSSLKASVYDVIGPLLAKNGGIGERRYYIAKDSGIKGSSVYADEFMSKFTLIGVFTGVRDLASKDKKYEWGYPSIPLNDGVPIAIGTDAMHGGNMLRFFNDGNPENLNCEAVTIAWENRWYIVYTAKKDIYPGQELTVSYGPRYWDKRGFTS